MSGVHARLSASSAHRWLECPGSINLAIHRGDETSVYAAEGTFAHDIAAKCLEQNFPALHFIGHTGEVEGHKFTCTQEMADAIQVYLDATLGELEAGDEDWVEMPLLAPLQKIDPDLGGTADWVRYRPAKKHLRVADLKFGSGKYVEVDSNVQTRLYALGAMLQVNREVEEVEVVIVQPRFEGAKPVRTWTFKAHDLLDFIADIQEAAALSRSANPPLKAGEWCGFCKAASVCPELKAKQDAIVAVEFGQVVDYAALAKALAAIPMVKERIKAIEEIAYKEATGGAEIPGFKLVEKRPSRQWSDVEAVKEWGKANAVDVYAEPDLLSVAQLEKRLGETAPKGKKKEAGKVLEPFVVKVSSGMALVPEADDRPAVKKIAAPTDFAAIDGAATGVKLF